MHDGSTSVALVTGGGSGIGRELCRLLHARGWPLFVVSLGEDELAELRAELGADVRTLAMDLTQPGAGRELHAATRRLGIDVELLVNCAGFGLFGAHLDLDPERVDRMLQLNVSATTELCTRFGLPMRERGHGRILNVVSTSAFQPLPGLAAYAASKHYLAAFSEALAEELAPHGVQVSLLFPGTTRTPFLQAAGVPRPSGTGSIGDLALRVAMDPRQVAEAAIAGLERGERHIVPGVLNRAHRRVAQLAPEALLMRLFGAAARR